MTFANGTWLWLLMAVPVLGFVLHHAQNRARKKLDMLLGSGAERYIENATETARSWRRTLLLAGVACLIVALARPQWGANDVVVTQRGTDLVVALDVSNSMRAQDVTPDRLIRARGELEQLLDGYDLGQVGLVLFAGQAFVQCPLTLDLGSVLLFLGMADTDMISSQGTALAAALETAAALLEGGDESYFEGRRAVLLVTDGEDLEGDWQAAADKCDASGITIFPIAVGSEEGGLIPDGEEGGAVLKDQEGNVVISRLDLASLESLAAATGGKVYRLGTGALDRDDLMAELSGLGQRDLEDRHVSAYQERFHWPLALALMFLTARFLIRPTGRSLVAGLLSVMMIFAWSEPALALDLMDHHAASIGEGADLYRAGQYESALEVFQQARSRRPDDPRLALAVGETLWRLERYEDASREFERAVALTDDSDLKAEGHYNAGTSALSAGDPETATRSLQMAAALAPAQSDILRNLEIAQTQLEQAQQQQEQSDQQEQNDQPDEDQQDQEQQDQEDQQDDDRQQDQDQQEQGEQQDQDQDQQQEPSEPEQPDQQEMSRQRAEEILKSLDRDEEELKRSIPKRLQGTRPRSGRKW